MKRQMTWNAKLHEMQNDADIDADADAGADADDDADVDADADARSMTPSRNTRSYTLRSVPSSPGRSFLAPKELL